MLLSEAGVVRYGWLLIIDTAEGKVNLNIEIKIHCSKGSATCRRLFFFFFVVSNVAASFNNLTLKKGN